MPDEVIVSRPQGWTLLAPWVADTFCYLPLKQQSKQVQAGEAGLDVTFSYLLCGLYPLPQRKGRACLRVGKPQDLQALPTPLSLCPVAFSQEGPRSCYIDTESAEGQSG